MISQISLQKAFKTMNKKFKYSFIITEKEPMRMRYKFDYAVGFKPHPNKIVYGGDDASYVSDNILAVADGVGAWTQGQENPSIYARKMIHFIEKIYNNEKKMTVQHPIYAVDQAIKLVRIMGSTTLTIMTLHPETGLLSTYYIGDSVYGFFRKQDVEMVYPQMISFNKPYQIGYFTNKVKDGFQNEYPVEQVGKDMIVLGSDGLWDNLTLDRIHYEIRGPGSVYKNGLPKSMSEIVENLAELTYKFSLSSNYLSPIHKRAIQQGINYPKEGKVDDITVILAQIARVEMKKNESYF